MSTQNISGNWTGTIIYGKKYRMHAGKELYFDAEINQTADLISGTAIDTGGFGVTPDPADISGTVSNDEISFVKRYRTLHYMDDQGERVVDRSKPGYDIFYSGIYDKDNEKFAGIWEYRIPVKILGFIPFMYRGGGTWMMSRKNRRTDEQMNR